MKTSTFSTVILLISLLVLSASPVSASGKEKKSKGLLQVHPYFAAVCVTLSKRCNWFYEKYSGGCKQHTSFYRQPQSCTDQVCPWCTRWESRASRFPCGTRRVMKLCNMTGPGFSGPTPSLFPSPSMSSPMEPASTPTASPTMTPIYYYMPLTSPSPLPSPSTSPTASPSDSASPSMSMPPTASPSTTASAVAAPDDYQMMQDQMQVPVPMQIPDGSAGQECVWTGEDGDNKVVIDLGRVPLADGWDRIQRGKYSGIIFNRSPARGISPPGKYGKMCFKVSAPMDGGYYFTAISYAPHNTEHNDVWVESAYGFTLVKWGDQSSFAKPGKWLKAYQNNGKKGMSEMFKTVDHNGHRFIIPGVKKNRTFTVCMAGRSKKYEMYQLILVKCEDMYCRGGIMKGLFDMKPSKCM